MIRDGLDGGAITKADLAELAGVSGSDGAAKGAPVKSATEPAKPAASEDHLNKALSVIDTLFYLAGLILFAAARGGSSGAGHGLDRKQPGVTRARVFMLGWSL